MALDESVLYCIQSVSLIYRYYLFFIAETIYKIPQFTFHIFSHIFCISHFDLYCSSALAM